jgi:excisionase family DNA binding protein
MARSVRELMQAILNEAAVTVDETAVLLSLSRHGAYEGVKTGEIPSIRIGRCIRVPCAGLRAMLGIERREPPEEINHRQDRDALRKDMGPKAATVPKAARPAPIKSRKPIAHEAAAPRQQRKAAARKSSNPKQKETAAAE